MPLVLNATPGDIDANSYETIEGALERLSWRLFTDSWTDQDPGTSLIMATRIIDRAFQPRRRLVRERGENPVYVTGPQWTGLPATTEQRLAWPRTGMKDSLGRDIPADAIPEELKDAVVELALQFQKGDRTLDNDVSVQGITSVRAGSVSVNFKDSIEAKVIPDAVINLMPPSWFTDEKIENAYGALIFQVL